MTTKISGGPIERPVAPARVPASAAGGSGAAAGPAAARADAADSVSLTRDAVLMQEVTAAAAGASGVDAARVARVSAELRDGSYRVDPQAIAAKMLKNEWELYG